LASMQILPGYMNSPERIRHCLANAAECERAAVATALRTNVRAHYASPDQCREVGADEHALGIVRRGLAIGVVGFGDGVLDVVGAVATEVADFTFR
jgi:hypothetical protein